MSARLSDRGIRAVLLDIEGTTTPISFVHDILFPYARAHLGAYLRDRVASDEARDVMRRLTSEHAADLARGESPPAWRAGGPEDRVSIDGVISYVEWLMDRDRKSPGLKLLQGYIWEEGYQAGQLRGQVFADVPGAIRRWRDAGIVVAIYSSGSELAQRRLFGSIDQGDLTPWLSGFFDTAVGPKMAAESYARIVSALATEIEIEIEARQTLFISDVTAELAAARGAGLQVLLSIRPGNAPQQDAAAFEAIKSFDELVP